MRRHYRPMTAAQHDARADRRRAEAEAAGLPIRDDGDARSDVTLDLRGAFGPLLIWRPCRGKLAGRLIDAGTGDVICRASIKEALHAAADRLPRMMAPRSVW